MATELQSPGEWARGRLWMWRAPLLAWTGWMALTAIRDPDYESVFRGANFAIHEFGHIAFLFFGEFMTIAGGSIMQLLVPAAAGLLILRQQGDWFALAVCGGWFAGSLAELSRYIGDARSLQLDLVSMGEAAPDSDVTGHDWQYLLIKTHLLQRDVSIAVGCRFVASIILLASVLFGVWLLWRMATAPKPQSS